MEFCIHGRQVTVQTHVGVFGDGKLNLLNIWKKPAFDPTLFADGDDVTSAKDATQRRTG